MEIILRQAAKVRLGKNRSGNWELAWTESGRTRRVSCRTQDRQSAEAFRAAWIAATMVEERGVGGAARTSLIVGDIAGHYVAAAGFGRTSQEWSLRAVRDPANGLAGLRPGEVTQNDVDAFTGLRRRLGGVKDGTVRRELGAMIAALNWAARGRLIGRDEVPVGLRLPPEGQARRGCLLEEDEARLWAAAIAASPARDLGPLSRVSRFVCLALATAARKEAILTLRWGQVDFGSGLIDFKDVSRVASKKRRARIPIASRLLPVLERAHFEAEDPVNGFVLDHRGEIKRAFGVFVAGLGEPFAAITPHDLRRTWATLRARRGVSMWEIAEVLGDSIATVVKHYAVHQPDHLRSAVE